MPITLDGTTGIILSGAAGLSQTGDGELTLGNTLDVSSGGTGTNTLIGIVKGDGSNALTAGKVNLVTEISGTLNVASGGTGGLLPVANGGTGGLLPVANGGTGLTAVGTSGNVLISTGTAWVSQALPKAGTIQAVASGSLSDGTLVIVNADGTVSAVGLATTILNTPSFGTKTTFTASSVSYTSGVYEPSTNKVIVTYQSNSLGYAIVGTVSGNSITFGTPVQFNAGRTEFTSITYDPTSAGKIIIVWSDAGNSDYGTYIVGTVSGTSITFGSKTVFSSLATQYCSTVYDVLNSRVVTTYKDATNLRGLVVVGTVSGTSVSFGTPVVFTSDNLSYISSVYDSTNQKVVVTFRNNSTSYGQARVGTVSGTSISFGTVANFNSVSTEFTSATYDSTNQKVVIFYRNVTSTRGEAVVGTVSGTSISFGTPVVFETGDLSFTHRASAYDSTANKVIISYRDDGNLGYATVCVGTVSGNTISFGTPFIYLNGATSDTVTIYNSTNNKIILLYTDGSNNSYGAANVGNSTTSVISSNMTAENYIGISDGSYANGQTATIQIVGAVDDAQSNLVAGQSYYAQGNGSLGLTPDSISVFAGTAISSNKIIIKG